MVTRSLRIYNLFCYFIITKYYNQYQYCHSGYHEPKGVSLVLGGRGLYTLKTVILDNILLLQNLLIITLRKVILTTLTLIILQDL